MAKRGTLTHRRTRRIASGLGIEVPFALGLMEAIFHVTADKAPAGDIGRMTDQAIAEELFYLADAAELVRVLVGAGLLEEHAKHRLVVHGWSEHADDAVRKKLARAGLCFWDGRGPWCNRRQRDDTPESDHGAPPADHGAPDRSAGRPPEPEPSRAKPRQSLTDLPAAVATGKALALRETWLTPYADAWRERWGAESEPPVGEMLRPLAQARKAVGDAEALARWRRFLRAAETSQWARPARFTQGLGEWVEGASRASPRRGQHGVTEGNVAEMQRFLAATAKGGGGQ